MHRIEFGNRALCLFVVSIFNDDGSQTLLQPTGMSINCLLNRILYHTNRNLIKFGYKKTSHTRLSVSIVETLQWRCIRRREPQRPLVEHASESSKFRRETSMENHSRKTLHPGTEDDDNDIGNENVVNRLEVIITIWSYVYRFSCALDVNRIGCVSWKLHETKNDSHLSMCKASK